MSLAARTRLGRYEIQNPLGAGGMGEVYRARDERLGRDVAIKVLPSDLTSDRDRLKRFETEARAASALTHPNIVTIHQVEQSGSTAFIVMELVEGKTLRRLLAGGALPLRKMLAIGTQIAEGLARAHASGIVHRDLKPENVMVTSDGRVKILDFGLAKLAHPEAHEGQPVDAATVSQLTRPGIVMGTVGYMSPEQAAGHPVDFRSDQFSLGSILYEMATGKQAFKHATSVQTLAAIIQEEPESIAAANPKVPVPLRWIVERCLAKEPRQRYASTEDLARELATLRDRIAEVASGESAALSSRIRRPRRWLILAAAAALLAAIATLALLPRSPTVASGRRYFDVVAPDGGEAGESAVSPDGQRIVFKVRTSEGGGLLFLREFSEPEARPLPGTETGFAPFWSPDSRTVGFFTRMPTQQPRGGKLKRIGIRDASPLEICDALGGGASWGSDDTILFGSENGVFHVPAAGGQANAVTRLDTARGELHHTFPFFLPDGRRFLFTVSMKDGSYELGAASLDDPVSRKLGKIPSPAAYSSPGYVLSITNGTLVADRFDADSLRLLGRRVPIAEDVGFWEAFPSSRDGVVSYLRSVKPIPHKVVWFDRSGTMLERLALDKEAMDVELSPDGSKAVFVLQDPNAGTYNLWLYEFSRATLTRLTVGGRAGDWYPTWSPDGRQIAFVSNQIGSLDLYTTPSTGLGPQTPLFESDSEKLPNSWSPDGRFLLYEDRVKGDGKTTLWAIDIAGKGKPFRVANPLFREEYGRFSPDGRLIAYLADETGRNEVYVQTFPEATQRWQISSGGAGQRPLWRADGKELFYLSPDNQMMSVEIERRPVFRAGKPRTLFRLRESPIPGRVTATDTATRYDVTPDGQRFLIIYADREAPKSPLTVVFNWLPDSER